MFSKLQCMRNKVDVSECKMISESQLGIIKIQSIWERRVVRLLIFTGIHSDSDWNNHFHQVRNPSAQTLCRSRLRRNWIWRSMSVTGTVKGTLPNSVLSSKDSWGRVTSVTTWCIYHLLPAQWDPSLLIIWFQWVWQRYRSNCVSVRCHAKFVSLVVYVTCVINTDIYILFLFNYRWNFEHVFPPEWALTSPLCSK